METWKDIKDFKGFYQVSNLGRVKRLATNFTCKSRWNQIRNISFKEKILTPCIYTNGYSCVSLCTQDKKIRPMLHRLVAMHFINNEFNKCQVNHINGIKNDNRAINLEWVTQRENMLHSYHVLKNQNVNQKKVINIETKEIYQSIRYAAIKYNIKYSTLYAYLSNNLTNKTKLKLYVN